MGELLHPDVVDVSPGKQHPHLQHILTTLRSATTKMLQQLDMNANAQVDGGRWLVAAGYDDIRSPRQLPQHRDERWKPSGVNWHHPTCDELDEAVGGGVR